MQDPRIPGFWHMGTSQTSNMTISRVPVQGHPIWWYLRSPNMVLWWATPYRLPYNGTTAGDHVWGLPIWCSGDLWTGVQKYPNTVNMSIHTSVLYVQIRYIYSTRHWRCTHSVGYPKCTYIVYTYIYVDMVLSLGTSSWDPYPEIGHSGAYGLHMDSRSDHIWTQHMTRSSIIHPRMIHDIRHICYFWRSCTPYASILGTSPELQIQGICHIGRFGHSGHSCSNTQPTA